jgi:hypothetical protein
MSPRSGAACEQTESHGYGMKLIDYCFWRLAQYIILVKLLGRWGSGVGDRGSGVQGSGIRERLSTENTENAEGRFVAR